MERAADTVDAGAYPMVKPTETRSEARKEGVRKGSEVEDREVLQGLLKENELIVEVTAVGKPVEGSEEGSQSTVKVVEDEVRRAYGGSEEAEAIWLDAGGGEMLL